MDHVLQAEVLTGFYYLVVYRLIVDVLFAGLLERLWTVWWVFRGLRHWPGRVEAWPGRVEAWTREGWGIDQGGL